MFTYIYSYIHPPEWTIKYCSKHSFTFPDQTDVTVFAVSVSVQVCVCVYVRVSLRVPCLLPRVYICVCVSVWCVRVCMCRCVCMCVRVWRVEVCVRAIKAYTDTWAIQFSLPEEQMLKIHEQILIINQNKWERSGGTAQILGWNQEGKRKQAMGLVFKKNGVEGFLDLFFETKPKIPANDMRLRRWGRWKETGVESCVQQDMGKKGVVNFIAKLNQWFLLAFEFTRPTGRGRNNTQNYTPGQKIHLYFHKYVCKHTYRAVPYDKLKFLLTNIIEVHGSLGFILDRIFDFHNLAEILAHDVHFL